MKKIIYLTFNDPPSGIYSSQVTDVCGFIKLNFNAKVRLIAFVSSRKYFSFKKNIQKGSADALVLPMFPGIKNWKMNYVVLQILILVLRPSLIIARGPFACLLSLVAAKLTGAHVCFDSRGAYAAEFSEYNVAGDKFLTRQMPYYEKQCVLESDFRLAVSNRLVEYWEKSYGYSSPDHSIIPCTLQSDYKVIDFDEEKVKEFRTKLGFSEEDIVCMYAGSAAGWQSFGLMDTFFTTLIGNNNNIKLAIFSFDNPELKVKELFPGNVLIRQVQHAEIQDYLMAGDYGILIREDSVTNQVASPTKFAEYLFSGLKCLISENIGDGSTFVKENQCGVVIQEGQIPGGLSRTIISEKTRLSRIAMEHFSKKSFLPEFRKLVDS